MTRAHAKDLGTARHAGSPAGARRSSTAPVPGLLALQRAAGNRAVSAMIGAAALRPLPGGTHTRPLPTPASPAAPTPTPLDVSSSVEAAVGPLGVDILRAGTAPVPPVPPEPFALQVDGLGGGEPIPAEVRGPYERSFGYDLSPVRLHRGPVAQRAASAAQAAAFTLGDHIVLGSGLDPYGPAGRQVLGHELAHTVQSRLGGGGTGRISNLDWPAEREAETAGAAAAAGRSFRISEQAGDDLHRIAPWLILAGIGLAAGLVVWATSDSPEENQRRHETGGSNPSEELWTLIPIYGSIQQIREADSYFQRVLGVGFLMLDFATLGTTGVAGRALIKAPGALIRTAIARRGSTALVVREGGEIVSEAMAKETAAAFTREGGTLLASRAAASEEMLAALSGGSLVVATEGGLNHAVIYAKNAAGQVMKVHGGPTRVLFTEATREVSEKTAQSMAKRANAYVVIEGGGAAVGIEEAVAQVSKSGPAALRWLGGNPTSCGIVQGALLEASGLPAETLAKIVPAGGASARMLPISLLETAAGSGSLRFVEGGMTWIVGGTLIQGALLGTVGAGAGPLVSTSMRIVVNAGLPKPEPDRNGGQATGSRTLESDDAAIAIVARFGKMPVGPASTVHAALPELVPGWYVRNPDFPAAVRQSLVHIGMPEDIAREIVGA